MSLPMGTFTEATVGCRILTTFRSSSEGCGASFRRGRILYVHGGLGFFQTPQYERYVRFTQPAGQSTTSNPSADRPGTTVIDPTRATVYYAELGPGIAMWPTRQINIHVEGGGFLGPVRSGASLVLPTSDSTGFGLGFFAGLGASYRLSSHPWALGFDYRVQSVPYGGIGSGEAVEKSGVEVGHSLFGLAHSFGVSAIVRFEDDRSN